MNNKKDMQVIIAIRKDIFNTIIVKNETNLFSYFYYICLDIKKIDRQIK